MKIIVLFLSLSSMTFSQSLFCDFAKMKFHSLPVETSDTQYLAVTMGWSYGREEVKSFIPHLKKFSSNMYYIGRKLNTQMVYIIAEYKSKKYATKAYEHLKRKWGSSNRHRVYKKVNSVYWFGNTKMSSACFSLKVSEVQKKLKLL